MSDWREEYQRKLVSPDEAVRCIESGDQVFTYAQAAMPVALMEALARRKVAGCDRLRSKHHVSLLHSTVQRLPRENQLRHFFLPGV